MSTTATANVVSVSERKEKALVYDQMKSQTGLTIVYEPQDDGGAVMRATAEGKPVIEARFAKARVDEAHILYMESTELLRSRAALHEDHAGIRMKVDKLFALFRGENVSFVDESAEMSVRKPSGEFVANPGKSITIDVLGVTYERWPVRTRLITTKDTDLLPIIEAYVKPYLKPGDVLYVSEKALTITQGRVVSMGTVKPSWLAHFLGSRVENNYGSSSFKGFGHGTALAMQLFIEEAGYPRVLFAAGVAAVTRPFGIRGMFYRICGKRAKSIDCPMSFLVLEYAHSVKLAPNNTNAEARRFRQAIGGNEVVILDANYRGAFSLGKSNGTITEEFIGKLFRDNPLGQSDEMTPFAIVRKV